MGCVSSKLVKKEVKQDILLNNGGDLVNHVVSLTSSTYGVLKLESESQRQPIKEIVLEEKGAERSPRREEPEVINAWELMEDLEEGIPIRNHAKKSPKSRVQLPGFVDKDVRSQLKFLNRSGSPKTAKRFGGKENRGRVIGVGNGNRKLDFSPKSILRVNNSLNTPCKAVMSMSFPVKSTKGESLDGDSGFLSRRRSFSPLFDPELVTLYEKELSEEEEHIEMVISPVPDIRYPRKSQDSGAFLQLFDEMCPPGGKNAVVFYTTTLRGIRKTFEDCNTVRSILESHCIQMFERDISMDSGFKEELRALMGTRDVKVPMVFVKGRVIGGIEDVEKMEEEGKLGNLLEGIPRSTPGCQGCGGMRFVMCMECNGSCRVLNEEHKKMVRCGECNENGLIQCPMCSS
ncbi:hypothetical protein SLE2022_079530 [Rubroshorea leprosula]